MNKKNWIAVIIIFSVLLGVGFWIYFSNNYSNNSNYQANRTSTDNSDNFANVTSPESNTENNNNANETDNSNNNSNSNESNQTEINNGIQESETPSVTEEQIATFTTKIY